MAQRLGAVTSLAFFSPGHGIRPMADLRGLPGGPQALRRVDSPEAVLGAQGFSSFWLSITTFCYTVLLWDPQHLTTL
jgi:hypothetical protein